MIDHDRLFKELLITFFMEFIELFFPELAAYLDPRSLVFLDKELFTDVTSGQRHEADLVARGKFRGQDSFFLVHVEHQAQDQRDFGRRMFGYFARLHEKHDLPVYPIALFSHNQTRPERDRYEVTFPDCEVLRFRFRVIQLKRLHWRDFLRHSNPIASALMARMGFKPEERVEVKMECLRLLSTFKLDPARQRLISDFIDTYLHLNRKETLQFERMVAMLPDRNERKRIMELTTSWKEEGRREGRQEGRQEGREEGRQEGRQAERVALVSRQLERKVGPLNASAARQVRRLRGDQLERLAEALLFFTTADDLKHWLARNR